MKLRHGLLLTAALAMFGTGCDDEEAVSAAGTLVLSIQFAPEITGVTRIVVQSASADADGNFAPAAASGETEIAPTVAELKAKDSKALSQVLDGVAAGTYRVTASGYVGDASQPAGSASVDVTVVADMTSVASLLLGGASDLSIVGLVASTTTPKVAQTIDLTATLSSSAANLVWSDNCDGEFIGSGASVVQWSKPSAGTCTITLVASTATTTATATLDLSVALAKGTQTFAVGNGSCFDDAKYDLNNISPVLTGNETPRSFSLTIPGYIDIDTSGRLVFTERVAGRVWRYDPSNDTLARLAGPIDPIRDCDMSVSGDGGLALDACFQHTMDVDVDPTTGNILVTDDWENEVRIIYANGLTIETFPAGTPSSYTWGVEIDSAGDVFVASSGGTSSNGRLRKVYASGLTNVSFGTDAAWDVDSYGDYVYVTDRFDSYIYRQARSGGPAKIIAGAYDSYNDYYVQGFSGDGGYASGAALSNPRGIYADASNGDIYFADSGNRRIRKITQTGIISTVVETLGAPGDLVIDSARNIYYVDRPNCSIVKVQGPY